MENCSTRNIPFFEITGFGHEKIVHRIHELTFVEVQLRLHELWGQIERWSSIKTCFLRMQYEIFVEKTIFSKNIPLVFIKHCNRSMFAEYS